MRVFLFCTLLAFAAVGSVLAQDTNFATGPQYLNYGSPLFARSLTTPTLSLDGPPLEMGANNATAGLIAGAENRIVTQSQSDTPPAVNLFPIYYGAPEASVVEISFSESTSVLLWPSELPASLLDTGVSQSTSAQTLRGRGYGVTLAEAAAHSKATAAHASRVYTNADIDRLHGKS